MRDLKGLALSSIFREPVVNGDTCHTTFPSGSRCQATTPREKRPPLVDVCERIPALWVSSASVQDRDGAAGLLIDAAAESFPAIEKTLADRAYVSPVVQEAACAASTALQAIKRDEQVKGFAPVRRRWVGQANNGMARSLSTHRQRLRTLPRDRIVRDRAGHGGRTVAKACARRFFRKRHV